MKKIAIIIGLTISFIFGMMSTCFAYNATALIPDCPIWSGIGSNKGETWYLLQNPIIRNIGDEGDKIAICKMVYRKGERISKNIYIKPGSYEYKIVWLNNKSKWYAIMAVDLYDPNDRLILRISDDEMIKMKSIEKIPYAYDNIGGKIIDVLKY